MAIGREQAERLKASPAGPLLDEYLQLHIESCEKSILACMNEKDLLLLQGRYALAKELRKSLGRPE